MADIPLTRGQFLLPFVSILDDIGAPTETLLERSRLPSSLAEKSELYLPLLPALRFVETAQRTQGIADFGFLAAQRLHFSHMREKTRALIANSPTLLVAGYPSKNIAADLKISQRTVENHRALIMKKTGAKSLPALARLALAAALGPDETSRVQ